MLAELHIITSIAYYLNQNLTFLIQFLQLFYPKDWNKFPCRWFIQKHEFHQKEMEFTETNDSWTGLGMFSVSVQFQFTSQGVTLWKGSTKCSKLSSPTEDCCERKPENMVMITFLQYCACRNSTYHVVRRKGKVHLPVTDMNSKTQLEPGVVTQALTNPRRIYFNYTVEEAVCDCTRGECAANFPSLFICVRAKRFCQMFTVH